MCTEYENLSETSRNLIDEIEKDLQRFSYTEVGKQIGGVNKSTISRLINDHLPKVLLLLDITGRKIVSKDDDLLPQHCVKVSKETARTAMNIVAEAMGDGPLIRRWRDDLIKQGVYDEKIQN